MADSGAFAFVCEQLEQVTDFDRLQARGTVRIALRQAGLEPGTVTPAQMKVVLEKILPGELGSRGIEGGEDVCRRIETRLASQDIETRDAPDEVFARLGGS